MNDFAATAAMMKLSEKRRTSHVLHLLLSIITVGIWLPVWVLVHASNVSVNQKIDNEVRRLSGMPAKQDIIGLVAQAAFMLVLLAIAVVIALAALSAFMVL